MPAIAVLRFAMRHLGQSPETRCPQRVARIAAAVDLMERHRAGAEWMVGVCPTIADVAVFAYTHWATEGA